MVFIFRPQTYIQTIAETNGLVFFLTVLSPLPALDRSSINSTNPAIMFYFFPATLSLYRHSLHDPELLHQPVGFFSSILGILLFQNFFSGRHTFKMSAGV